MVDEVIYNHFAGALAALASAFLWAIAALMFSQMGEVINARTMNLAKGLVALICLSVLVIPGGLSGLDTLGLLLLALSGLLGIALGDTLYFLALRRLGARLTLLLGTLIPVVTALAGFWIFNESLSAFAIAGLGLTLLGVCYVLWDKSQIINDESSRTHWQQQGLWIGVLIAFLFVVTESAGILLSKAGVQNLDSLEATFIRQVFGIAGLVFWGLLAKGLLDGFKPFREDKKLTRKFVFTALIGAFLGTWLSIYALKMTYASVAVALNSTSPLFVIPLAIWFLREKVRKQAVFGAVIAVLGVMLYFLSLS